MSYIKDIQHLKNKKTFIKLKQKDKSGYTLQIFVLMHRNDRIAFLAHKILQQTISHIFPNKSAKQTRNNHTTPTHSNYVHIPITLLIMSRNFAMTKQTLICVAYVISTKVFAKTYQPTKRPTYLDPLADITGNR